MTQKWKTDPSLYNAPTEKDGNQIKKKLDYSTTYRKEFLDCDPLRDWPSFDRCKWLWDWAMELLYMTEVKEESFNKWSVLDCGTKDAQFPAWLREQGIMATGLEFSEKYVRYSLNKGRPIQWGNVCDMEFEDDSFDCVFAHHLLGLVPNNLIALQEMYRVSKKYVINLSQIPGNKRKHYSYMKDSSVFNEFITSVDCEVLHNGYLDTGIANEWVLFLKKKGL